MWGWTETAGLGLSTHWSCVRVQRRASERCFNGCWESAQLRCSFWRSARWTAHCWCWCRAWSRMKLMERTPTYGGTGEIWRGWWRILQQLVLIETSSVDEVLGWKTKLHMPGEKPLLLAHGGIRGCWSERLWEMLLTVVACWGRLLRGNVIFLQTSHSSLLFSNTSHNFLSLSVFEKLGEEELKSWSKTQRNAIKREGPLLKKWKSYRYFLCVLLAWLTGLKMEMVLLLVQLRIKENGVGAGFLGCWRWWRRRHGGWFWWWS